MEQADQSDSDPNSDGDDEDFEDEIDGSCEFSSLIRESMPKTHLHDHKPIYEHTHVKKELLG